MSDLTISVAMATYNGTRFIREQLNSIANQLSLPDELVIGDDGSSDETIAIIEDFSKTAPFPVHLTVNKENLGYGENFLRTMSRCQSDWIATCDQDDVWLEHKLAKVRRVISSGPADLVLVVHQGDMVDENLVKTGTQLQRFPNKPLVPRRGHKCFWVFNGMGLILKRQIVEDVDWKSRPPYHSDAACILTHDAWMCHIANAVGSTAMIPDVCVLYRRHSSAVFYNNTAHFGFFRWAFERLRAVEDGFVPIASISKTYASYFQELSECSPEYYREKFKEYAEDFNRLANIAQNREIIQRHPKLSKRMLSLVSNITLEAYGVGKPYSLGLKSIIRDTARIFRII